MSKNQEIQRLDAIIKNLPAESYLHATLVHIRVQFEQDIRSDFETLPNLQEIQQDIASAQSARKDLIAANKVLSDRNAVLEAKIASAKGTLEKHARQAHDLSQRLAADAAWYDRCAKQD